MAQLFGTPRITSMFKPIGERCATAPPLSGEAASKSRGQDVDVESDEDSDDADYQPPAKIGLPRDMRNMNDDQGQSLQSALEELEKDQHVTPTQQGVIFDHFRKFAT